MNRLHILPPRPQSISDAGIYNVNKLATDAASPVQGPGTLQFRWRRQRNTQDQNFELGAGETLATCNVHTWEQRTVLLRFDLDGTIRGSASQPGWQTFGYEVPAGTHTFGWTCLRGNAGTNSACAKLDRLSWQPGVTLSGAANSGATSFGSTAWASLPLAGASHDLVIASPLPAVGRDARLTTTLSGARTLSFSWYREATASPPSLTLSRNSTRVSSLGFSGVWQRTSFILAPGTHNLEWRATIQSGAPSDTGIVTLTPQFSTDLSTWRDAVSQVVFNDGTLEYLRAFIPADEGQIFFRVKATLTP